MKKTKVFTLTNIPTPYRNHFFNCLEEEGTKRSIETKVYYMAPTEKGRYWNHKDWEIKYKYEFLRNYGIRFKGVFFHLNPSIIGRLCDEKPDYLIVAGSWNFPTVMLVLLFQFLYPSVKLGFWNEGNFLYETYTKKGFFRKIKGFFYRKFHFIISSGEKSDELVKFYVPEPKIVRLVNVIDEASYTITPDEHQKYQPQNPRRLFIASKLNERKNVFFFVKSLEGLLLETNVLLRIAGEGSEKVLIQEWVKEKKLENVIQVLGQVSEKQIKEELEKADIFCMPSKREPFPLSLIEAAFMYKPLLVSQNIGSLPEIMDDNGVSFDPIDSSDILAKVRTICENNALQLKKMGRNSRNRAEKLFTSRDVTRKFIDDILAIR